MQFSRIPNFRAPRVMVMTADPKILESSEQQWLQQFKAKGFVFTGRNLSLDRSDTSPAGLLCAWLPQA